MSIILRVEHADSPFGRSSASDSIEEVSRKLDAVVDALTSLDQGDVRQRDVLRALNVAFDRHGNGNPISL